MKNVFFALAFMLVGMFAFANSSNVEKTKLTYTYDIGSCTVSYTNSSGVTFSATAETCIEAYENIMPFIEAK
jgi:hypothetical protein